MVSVFFSRKNLATRLGKICPKQSHGNSSNTCPQAVASAGRSAVERFSACAFRPGQNSEKHTPHLAILKTPSAPRHSKMGPKEGILAWQQLQCTYPSCCHAKIHPLGPILPRRGAPRSGTPKIRDAQLRNQESQNS